MGLLIFFRFYVFLSLFLSICSVDWERVEVSICSKNYFFVLKPEQHRFNRSRIGIAFFSRSAHIIQTRSARGLAARNRASSSPFFLK